MSDDVFADPTPNDNVASTIGELAAALMDFTDQQQIAEVTIGGIVIAGKTDSGTPFVITRTTARDPFACTQLWASAIEVEADTARRDVQRVIGSYRARIAELEGIDE